MKLSILDPSFDNTWDNALCEFPRHSIFHTSAWARVLIATYHFTPLYVIWTEGEAVRACIPIMETKSIVGARKGISLPFSDYCDPLVDSAETFATCLSDLIKLGKERSWQSLELRGGQEHLKNYPPTETFFMHAVDIDKEPDRMLKAIRDSTRRNIGRAEAAGLQAEIQDSLQSIKEFFRIHCSTRKRHGLPPQPFRFFLHQHRYLISQKQGFLVVARFASLPISASIFLKNGKWAYYKHGASDLRFQKLRAANFTMWTAIRAAADQKLQMIHLGRTDSHTPGLLQFKRGWRPREWKHSYYFYNFNSSTFTSGHSRRTYPAFRLLPLWASRILGELFYKYAA